MSKNILLSLQNIDVFYGGLQALKEIALEVNQGEVTALIGTNGAGKSTIINAISGLVPPTNGKIIFNGIDTTNLKPYSIVDLGISQVPEGRAVFPELNVLDNLILGSYITRARPNKNKNLKRVYELFPILKKREHQLAGTLSGGEQQMVAIGRALMAEPKLILFDEISLGLAPKVVDEIYVIFKRIIADGLSILFVEQNTVRALNEAGHAYFLEAGRITLSGVAKQLCDREEIRKICFV